MYRFANVSCFGVPLRYPVVLMHDPRDSKPSSSGRSPEDRLDSWKEIAAYLGRGIRTVQRWERQEGLSVDRLAHDMRGSVYAQRDELTAWWESRRVTLASQSSGGADSDSTRVSRRLERVTHTSSMTSWPALSSDARLVAYVSDGGQDGTTPQIWIQQIGGAALQLSSTWLISSRSQLLQSQLLSGRE